MLSRLQLPSMLPFMLLVATAATANLYAGSVYSKTDDDFGVADTASGNSTTCIACTLILTILEQRVLASPAVRSKSARRNLSSADAFSIHSTSCCSD